tara:strand:+ start:5285 stop:6151 length:867 start_codon:yes stop_codon:yes gene_type:complete
VTKLHLLHPATFALDGGAMFGIIPKPLWEKKIKPDELNRIPMALRVMLVQTKNKNILIDTGIGHYHGEKFENQFNIETKHQGLIGSLKNVGLDPKDITDIILTHLHFDHVGGLTERKGESLFPDATLHLHQKHYEYGLNPTLRDSGSFQSDYFKPLIEKAKEQNLVHFLIEDSGVILEDEGTQIEYRISFGHTPYMVHPIVAGHIYMADLVPMSHHVHVPWVMGYDIEPGVTTVFKEKFYEMITERKLKMVFEHDLDTWGGTLKIDDKGRYVLDEAGVAQREPSQQLI